MSGVVNVLGIGIVFLFTAVMLVMFVKSLMRLASHLSDGATWEDVGLTSFSFVIYSLLTLIGLTIIEQFISIGGSA